MIAWHPLSSMLKACFLICYEVHRPVISAHITNLAPVVSYVGLQLGRLGGLVLRLGTLGGRALLLGMPKAFFYIQIMQHF